MPKIGLEIHGYILTEEKLFCPCKAIHGLKYSEPNTNICPICTSQPGSKPMLPNEQVIKKAIQIALILKCKINERLIWQRKHYDWPDLPKGYQNTISGTHAIPLGEKGEFLGIGIRECHLEEDPAAWNPKTGEIDYNRSGSPLIEIVTQPDFSSSQQVVEWLRQLIITLGYIKAFDKNSGIKADVNVSLPELKGERVEIKNINSIKNIQKAIEYEIQRQSKQGELAKKQETRMFNESLNITKKMREKERAQDYRFIHEPDLPVIILKKPRITKIKSSIPETPLEKLEKIIKKHKIDKKSAEVLTKKLEIVEFFEEVIKKTNPKIALPWVTTELLSVLNYNKKELNETGITPEKFVKLMKHIEKGNITELNAKDILRSWAVKKSITRGLSLKDKIKISNKSELEKICEKVIAENPRAVKDYKKGKKESLNFLIGKVMQLTEKRADYKTAKDLLEKLLK